MTGQCLQSQQQTRERSHVSHYQGKVTAYPMTHRFHWPVTTIRHHQPGIIMFNRFYLGPTSNIQWEWMDFSNYFCLSTHSATVPSFMSLFSVIIFFFTFETFILALYFHVFAYKPLFALALKNTGSEWQQKPFCFMPNVETNAVHVSYFTFYLFTDGFWGRGANSDNI